MKSSFFFFNLRVREDASLSGKWTHLRFEIKCSLRRLANIKDMGAVDMILGKSLGCSSSWWPDEAAFSRPALVLSLLAMALPPLPPPVQPPVVSGDEKCCANSSPEYVFDRRRCWLKKLETGARKVFELVTTVVVVGDDDVDDLCSTSLVVVVVGDLFVFSREHVSLILHKDVYFCCCCLFFFWLYFQQHFRLSRYFRIQIRNQTRKRFYMYFY